MNLAIVESPLQALNIIEYFNTAKNKNKKCTVVIFSNSCVSDANLKQIEFVLDFFSFNERLVLDINAGLKGLISSRRKIKALAKKLSATSVESCVLGEYRSLAARALVNTLQPNEVVVVDDGNATLRINRRLASTSISEKLRFLLASLFTLNIKASKEITFFSVYDIRLKLSKRDKFISNNYHSLKKKMNEYPDSPKEFIIGSPLKAAGVVDNDNELTLALINSIVENAKVSKKDLIYISHRRESSEKLTLISDYGVEVVSLSYPFELYTLVNNVNVVKIHGFYSSLFFNLLKLNDRISVCSYRFSLSLVRPQFKVFVENVYKTYRELGDLRLSLFSVNDYE
jgi:hypothetical protein